MQLSRQPFGVTPEGIAVELFTLSNDNGLSVSITNYGGIIVSIRTPDRHGTLSDITLGFDSLAEYVERNPFFGCITGRFANRIAKGRFTLHGVAYQLAQNNGNNHLHGGVRGFDKRVWTWGQIQRGETVGLRLYYRSPHNEENYPGNLDCSVIYTLNNKNELSIEYAATTDQPTILNLTNHAYFNLAGAGTILDHEILLNCNLFIPTDAAAIPTGEIRSVAGTPMDFHQFTRIGARIEQTDEQLRNGQGYDHCWVIDRQGSEGLVTAAIVREPISGRRMEVSTTQPGVQFYTGNMLPPTNGKGGQLYQRRDGFCLETQNFPDAPNQAHFPTAILNPGQHYHHTTVFAFGVETD